MIKQLEITTDVSELRAVSAPGAPSLPVFFFDSTTSRKTVPRVPPGPEGGRTVMRKSLQVWLPIFLVCVATAVASAQTTTQTIYQGGGSFRTQCPTATIRHPGTTKTGGSIITLNTVVNPTPESAEVPYLGPTIRTATQSPVLGPNGLPVQLNSTLTFYDNGGAIKCQEISGGDGYMTEADGNQTFMFSFGPLSGLQDIENGYVHNGINGGTEFAATFDKPYCDPNRPNYNSGQPNPYYDQTNNQCMPGTDPNGAVGYMPPGGFLAAAQGSGLTATVSGVGSGGAITSLTITNGGSGYPPVPCNTDSGICSGDPLAITGGSGTAATAVAEAINTTTGAITAVTITNGGTGYVVGDAVGFQFSLPFSYQAGADPAAIMNTGVMNGNIPGPLFVFDEDDEFFLTLTNVGMLMRPDLFEQHTVHFHGYPNASSFYDGVPEASLAINIGGSFTYYYMAPDAGTYFWHCHITPPEHLQMGMVGWLYVRPRQNRTPAGTDVYQTVLNMQKDLRTSCSPGLPTAAGQPGPDILCSVPLPATDVGFTQQAGIKYLYNDGDGSTAYDIDVPLQIHGFDPNFHFVGMTFNPEGFSDMKDKYFLLNGRSYPDTVGVAGGPADVLGQLTGATNPDPNTKAISTADSDTMSRPSQPAPALIVLSNSQGTWCKGANSANTCGQRAALRIDDLDVQEYQTLSSPSIPMLLVGFNAKLLRDQAGNNQFVKTNSITLGGGESLDVILDSTGIPPGTYFLYTPQLDHLSNDAENFGGLMTEVVVTP
jgi:hypothetical protein